MVQIDNPTGKSSRKGWYNIRLVDTPGFDVNVAPSDAQATVEQLFAFVTTEPKPPFNTSPQEHNKQRVQAGLGGVRRGHGR